MTKIALSGAGGQLGTVLRKTLLERGYDLRSAGGSRPLTPIVEGEDVMHGDLRDPAVVDRLLDGVDVLIHMAGTSVERPLPEIIENNLRGLVEVYEGARRKKRAPHRVRELESCDRHVPGRRQARARLRVSSRRLLRPEQDVGRRHRAHVLGQARHRERLRAHRQLHREADRVPAPEHLARASTI